MPLGIGLLMFQRIVILHKLAEMYTMLYLVPRRQSKGIRKLVPMTVTWLVKVVSAAHRLGRLSLPREEVVWRTLGP